MKLISSIMEHLPPADRRKSLNAMSCAFLFAFTVSQAAHGASAYADWAAVVVAGDWHAHDGSPSEIFDNARRDVARELADIGFSPANIEEFSARPDASNAPADARTIGNALWDLSNRTKGGCLVYFSSHGAPEALVLGNDLLAPPRLARMLANSCAARPTVVVISACFSGAFVAPLQAPNRLILTAAREDRTSFGCGQTDRYPYFDKCVLSVWPYADGFPALGRAAQLCVAAREKKEHLGPPSEPQLWIGAEAAAQVPKWR